MSDLIKNLNLWSESLESGCTVPNELMAEAADLIEQLQQRNDELTATVERLIAAGNEMSAAIDAYLQRIKYGE